ncbi:MAG: alpha/beta fold hydrolase [Anaerolineae bacterium]|nr:alpha/beta fold hydrolase [Anaerolineae bacterium]
MPLVFDMPYEELLTYEGTNPKPKDFDSFWKHGLEAIKSADSQVELVPAEFQTDYAECYHMFFTGIGGARIYAKLLKPRLASAKVSAGPAVLMFHGYSGNSGDWYDKLPYVAAGFTVAALDCRGQGGRSEDTGGVIGTTLNGHIVRGLDDAPENLLYRAIFLDTAQLADIVIEMPQIDGDRVGATGASQGGGLTLACAALEPRIRKAAPVFPFLSDYQRVWEIDQDVDAYEELRSWFRRFDPRHEREKEIFTLLGYIDVQHLASRIRADLLMAVGLMDTICPPSTQFAAYNKITSPKSMLTYPDYGHEQLPDLNDRIFEFMQEL